MIVPELQFRDLIATIPTYDLDGSQSLPLTYGWGTHETLLREIKQRHKNGSPLYPLVWWMMPYKRLKSRTSVWVDNVKIILAVNTLTEPLNPERYELTFRSYLEPNAELITEQALIFANNITPSPLFNREGEDVYTDIDVYPKMGNINSFDNNDENFVTDYWDAFIITFNARFTQNCLNVNSNQYNTEIITQWQY